VTANKTGTTSAKPASYIRCHAPHCTETSAGKVFHKLKAVSIFRWRHGNQRWNQQAEFSSVLAASSKSSSVAAVIEASVTALLNVPKLLATIHNARQVIAINKAEKVDQSMRVVCVITDAVNK
jgi:hypothetical protein